MLVQNVKNYVVRGKKVRCDKNNPPAGGNKAQVV